MALERGNKVGSVDLVEQLTDDTHIQAVILVDENGLPVSIGGGGGGGGSTIDRELVVTTYTVKTAFSGASVGDVITCTQVLDVTATPSVVATIWRNQTTATNLGSIPSLANLVLTGTSGEAIGSVGATAPVRAQMAGFVDKDGNLGVAKLTENDALAVGNAIQKFRDGFALGTPPDLSIWDLTWSNQGSSFTAAGGNSAGASYLKVSMCPITPNSEFILTSKAKFKFPVRIGYGMSLSQRILGQEFEISMIGCDAAGVIEESSPVADLTILGTVSITSNVATINFASAHGLNGGDRVVLIGNTERRLNVGPVVVTPVTATSITVPCTLANGTYTAGGVVRFAHPMSYISNGVGMVYENATVTNASFVAVRNSDKFKSVNQTVSTTTAIQSNTSPYTDAFNSAGDMEIISNMDRVFFRGAASDSFGAPTGGNPYTQGIPDEEKFYKIRIRAKNLSNLTVPIAKITAIAKTGTTTATVTTDVAHGLAVTDFVQIYGVRDITNFPNLTASTQVASIVSPTQFTIVIGTASTTSSAGGAVFINQGSVLAPGISAINVQSISRASNVLTLIGTGTWAGFLPGETIHLYGCDATSMGLYDGAYKVLRLSTSTLELESVGADFGSINCSGAVMRRTDLRMNYIRMMDYTRLAVEIADARGANDASRALQVNGAVSAAQSGTWNVATLTTLTGGGAAEDAAAGTSPVTVGGVVRTTTSPTTFVAGDAARDTMTSGAAKVVFPYSVPEVQATANLSLTTTTAQAIRAAGAAGIRNYVVGMQVYNSSASPVDVILLDGAAEIFRQTVNATSGREFNFDLPLKTTAAAALNVNLSAAVTAVRVTAQTFQSA